MLKINGAWYINQLPNHLVIELEDNNLIMVLMTPFRQLSKVDFNDYKGHHPRKCKGQPLPDYLYRFYGLEKNDESATEVIHVRLTQTEKTKIETFAANQEPKKTTSEAVRDYIRGL